MIHGFYPGPCCSITATTTPRCGNVLSIAQTLTGASNSSNLVTISVSAPLVYNNIATCGLTSPLGPKAVFAIDLGNLPLGFPLNIQTCNPGVTTYTYMWAGECTVIIMVYLSMFRIAATTWRNI